MLSVANFMFKAPIKTAADSKNWYLEFLGKQDLIFQQMTRMQNEVLFDFLEHGIKLKCLLQIFVMLLRFELKDSFLYGIEFSILTLIMLYIYIYYTPH